MGSHRVGHNRSDLAAAAAAAAAATAAPAHLLEWLLSKRQRVTMVGKNVEKREHLCTVGRSVNLCNHYEKHYGMC